MSVPVQTPYYGAYFLVYLAVFAKALERHVFDVGLRLWTSALVQVTVQCLWRFQAQLWLFQKH
jgi:hypothetical protein